jgi:hypothetical protein
MNKSASKFVDDQVRARKALSWEDIRRNITWHRARVAGNARGFVYRKHTGEMVRAERGSLIEVSSETLPTLLRNGDVVEI